MFKSPSSFFLSIYKSYHFLIVSVIGLYFAWAWRYVRHVLCALLLQYEYAVGRIASAKEIGILLFIITLHY